MPVNDKYLYINNAFRVLGLSIRASNREVRQRAQEVRLQLELAEAQPLELQRIRESQTTLEDPLLRLEHELYWFHLMPNPVPFDIDLTDAISVNAIAAALSPLVTSGSDEALHDLA